MDDQSLRYGLACSEKRNHACVMVERTFSPRHMVSLPGSPSWRRPRNPPNSAIILDASADREDRKDGDMTNEDFDDIFGEDEDELKEPKKNDGSAGGGAPFAGLSLPPPLSLPDPSTLGDYEFMNYWDQIRSSTNPDYEPYVAYYDADGQRRLDELARCPVFWRTGIF